FPTVRAQRVGPGETLVVVRLCISYQLLLKYSFFASPAHDGAKQQKGPGSAPGPNRVFSQNGASSDSAVGSLGGVGSSCSLRSSVRMSSARIRPRCDLRSLRLLAFAVWAARRSS